MGWIGSVTALVVVMGIAQAVPRAMAENIANDSTIRAALTKSLSNAKFKDIQTSVQNGTVSLTGTVNVYADKAEAEKKAHKLKAVVDVRDDIKVAGPEVPDQLLQLKLMRKIQYDRIGYGTTAFNAISVSVKNGVAVLGGSAYGPVDKDSALIDASYTAGVKDVIDNIKVDLFP
jgi:hyperosmotically inducible periplasmic protein